MNLLRIWVLIVSLGAAMFLAPSAAIAVPLSTLFQGESISNGRLTFSDWALISLQSANGGSADFDQINVFPISDDPLNSGIAYVGPSGALGIPSTHPGASSLRLSFSYRVHTNNGLPLIEEHSARLTGYNFFATNSTRIQVIQLAEHPSGADLSEIVSFVRPSDLADSPNLFSSEAFFQRQTALRITTTIDVAGLQANDFAQLTAFQQRFVSAIPEPSGAAISAVLLLCLWACGSRAGRK